jgi:hypothetical protein
MDVEDIEETEWRQVRRTIPAGGSILWGKD